MDRQNKVERQRLIRPIGVRAKLLLSFVLLTGVTTGAFFFIAFTNSRNMAERHMLQQIEQLATVFTDEIDREISKSKDFVEYFAQEPEVSRLEKEFLDEYFSHKRLNQGNLDALIIYDTGSNPIFKSFFNRTSGVFENNPILRNHVAKAIRSKQTFVFPADPCCTKPGTIFIASPIISESGETRGAVLGIKTIDFTGMEHIIYSHRAAGKKMQVYLVNQDGRSLPHSTRGGIKASTFGRGKLSGELERQWLSIRDDIRTKATEFYFEDHKEKYIATAAPVAHDLEWYILLVQPFSEAFSGIKAVSIKITLLGALALIVAVYLALYRSRRITKPISDLIQAVEEIARGDYSKRVRIYRRDEFGSLAFAFNRMSAVLQEKIAALQESQSQLEEAFNQLQNDTIKREESNRELSRKVRELTSLSKVTNAISNSLDLNVLLDTIVDTINNIMGFENCSIKLFDKSTNTLKINIVRGLGDEYLQKADTPFGEGISGLAVKMCKPIIINDVKTDPRVPPSHILHKLNVKSVISVPLITKQSVMGVLNLYSKTEHEFTEDEKQLLGIFATQAAAAIENARLFDSLRDSYLNTIQALSMAIDAKDRYTHGHSKRVSDVSIMIGRELKLSKEAEELLQYASDLHDIGKIGISEVIISKEGKLTVDEYEIIKTHPLVGETIIEPVPFLQDAKPVIRHHHERYDGYGYPDGLKGEEIPLLARIIHIADAYDAMTSDRPYRRALSHALAVQEIKKHSGSQFDPKVVEAFLRVFEKTAPD